MSNENLTKEQINKFYLGPLTKFIFIPMLVISITFMIIYSVQKDTEGITAGALFIGLSVLATVLSYFNDLRRNDQIEK